MYDTLASTDPVGARLFATDLGIQTNRNTSTRRPDVFARIVADGLVLLGFGAVRRAEVALPTCLCRGMPQWSLSTHSACRRGSGGDGRISLSVWPTEFV